MAGKTASAAVRLLARHSSASAQSRPGAEGSAEGSAPSAAHRGELSRPARLRLLSYALASFLVWTATGCSLVTVKPVVLDPRKWQELIPPKPRTPMHMVDVWTDTVLSEPGQKPLRGFGGRIMFFQHPEDKPVVVDGTLTVYLFEDEDDAGSPTRPLCRYVFLPEHLRQHYSRSKLGHSYSVWIPVDELGGPRRRLMIIARFEDAQTGQVIVSRPVRKTLPGPSADEKKSQHLARGEDIRGSALNQNKEEPRRFPPQSGPEGSPWPASSLEDKRGRVESTTIEIPPDVAAKIFGVVSPPPSSGRGPQGPERSPAEKESPADQGTASPGHSAEEADRFTPRNTSWSPSSRQRLDQEGGSLSRPESPESARGQIGALMIGQRGVTSKTAETGLQTGRLASGTHAPLERGTPSAEPPLWADPSGVYEPRELQLTKGGEFGRPGSASGGATGVSPPAGQPPLLGSFPRQSDRFPVAQSIPNRLQTISRVQRGPVVVPDFSPGRTQPHPVVWPSRPQVEPPHDPLGPDGEPGLTPEQVIPRAVPPGFPAW